jgi:ribosomal protein S27AE
MINQHGFTQQGWECPKCGRVYSPSTPMCLSCPEKTMTSTTTGHRMDITPPHSISTFDIGSTSTTFLCPMFIPNGLNTSATKCMRCGKEKIDHPQITNL